MVKYHLKRIAAPRTWPIKRKTNVFVTRPKPYGHKRDLSMPLSIVIKEVLNLAKTNKEVKHILTKKKVTVNGVRRYKINDSIGFLDILSFEDIKKHYRMFLDDKGKLYLYEIPQKEAHTILTRINGKTKIKGGKTQLNLLGGKNIIVEKDTYKTGDSIIITKNKITKHLPLKENTQCFIIKGKHKGKTGKIKEIKELITIETDKGIISTKKDSIIIIGEEKPEITIRGAS